MSKQQDVLNAFRAEIITAVGTELGGRVYDATAIDDSVMPLAIYSVITDTDEVLLGDGRINNTNIQVSFFAKKSQGVSTIRGISDDFVEYIDGYRLSNDMVVGVVLKGLTLINDINDENVQIITEFNVR